MLWIRLTVEQESELRAWRRDASLAPAERDRVEMVALSAAGRSVPEIATHQGCCAETVRRVFRRWPIEGWGVVRHQPPGPAPDLEGRARVVGILRELLAQERTWTAAQLAAALRARGIAIGGRQARRYLREVGSAWRRTQRTLTHKQNPEKVARAKKTLGFFANGRKQAS